MEDKEIFCLNFNEERLSLRAILVLFRKGSFSKQSPQPVPASLQPSLAFKEMPHRSAMKIGYARVSTEDQSLDLQLDALGQQGCTKIFQEKMTGTTKSRPALNKAIKALKPGDILVVWKLDRLGRSLQDLIEILKLLEGNGVGFHSISDGIDTTSSCGRLLFHIIGAIAEFECNQISERTKAGLQAARRRGSKLGRPRCLSEEQLTLARSLSDDLSLTDIAIQLNVGRTTLWRSLSRISA